MTQALFALYQSIIRSSEGTWRRITAHPCSTSNMPASSATAALVGSAGQPGRYLHVGCGLVAPENWVNIDASWNARLAKAPRLRSLLGSIGLIPCSLAKVPWPRNIRVWDVTRGLPYESESVAAIYASHFLEHLARSAARAFLEDTHRVLIRGGIIRLVVPDLEIIARRYLTCKSQGKNNDDPAPAEQFLEGLGVFVNAQPDEIPRLLRLYRCLNPLTIHKWLYDEASLRNYLARVGFGDIRRMAYLESRLPGIAEVEREERLVNALCLEGVRLQ